MLTNDDVEEMSRSEMVERIIELQEQKRYSDFDIDGFAEWCSENGWNYFEYAKKWKKHFDNYKRVELKTTSQLRELWEKDERRKQ